MTTHLFVYGTLLRRSRHPMAQMLAEQARHVGAGKVRGRLYDLGRFPGVVASNTDGEWVYGDVYDLGARGELLTQLDAYERLESPLPAYFDRAVAEITLEGGSVSSAWVYWYH